MAGVAGIQGELISIAFDDSKRISQGQKGEESMKCVPSLLPSLFAWPGLKRSRVEPRVPLIRAFGIETLALELYGLAFTAYTYTVPRRFMWEHCNIHVHLDDNYFTPIRMYT